MVIRQIIERSNMLIWKGSIKIIQHNSWSCMRQAKNHTMGPSVLSKCLKDIITRAFLRTRHVIYLPFKPMWTKAYAVNSAS